MTRAEVAEVKEKVKRALKGQNKNELISKILDEYFEPAYRDSCIEALREIGLFEQNVSISEDHPIYNRVEEIIDEYCSWA